MKKAAWMMLVVMVVSIFFATAAMAATSYTYGSSSTALSPGQTKLTSARKKEQTGSLKVTPSLHSPSGVTVWFGIRNTAGTRVHTSAVDRTSASSAFGVKYKSGYGIVGESYKLAVQNDSTSSKSVKVKGTFVP